MKRRNLLVALATVTTIVAAVVLKKKHDEKAQEVKEPETPSSEKTDDDGFIDLDKEPDDENLDDPKEEIPNEVTKQLEDDLKAQDAPEPSSEETDSEAKNAEESNT